MENNGSQTIYNNIASPDGNDRNEANEINLNKGKNDSFPLDFNQINEISESKLTAHFQNSNNNSVKEMNNPLNNKLSQSDIPSSNFNVIPHQTDVKENKSLNLTPNYNNNSPFNNISQNQTITNLPNFSQNDISALNQNNNQIQTNLPNFNENMDNRFDQNNQIKIKIKQIYLFLMKIWIKHLIKIIKIKQIFLPPTKIWIKHLIKIIIKIKIKLICQIIVKL